MRSNSSPSATEPPIGQARPCFARRGCQLPPRPRHNRLLGQHGVSAVSMQEPAGGKNRRHGWSAAGSSPINLPQLSRSCPGCSARTHTSCDPDASRFGRLRLPRSKQGAGKTGAHHGIVFRIVTAARGALFRNLHALESWVILNTVESDSEILRILIYQ